MMWKDSSFSSKNEDETKNDVVEGGGESTALHNKVSNHPEKDDKETLLKMNKKLGIEMPDCLVTSFDQNSNVTATTIKTLKPLAEVGKNISPSTERLESKLDSLVVEMRKLRQIDHEILVKFARINHNMDEVKWLMEERLQDMDDMEDFPPITTTTTPNHHNGFSTTSHPITYSQNKVFCKTNDLEKSTDKSPPQPMFSPSPPSTLTSNHLRPHQQQHKRTTSQLSRSSSSTASSSSSSMVSEDEQPPAASNMGSSAWAEKESQPPRPRPRLHLTSASNTNHASSNHHRTSPTCCNTLKTSHEVVARTTTISSSSDTANGNSVQPTRTLEGTTTNTIERRESNNNNSRFVMKSRTLSHSSVPLHHYPPTLQQSSLTRSNTTTSAASKFHRNLANQLARLGENIKFTGGGGKKSKSEKFHHNGGGGSSVWRKLRRRTSDVSSSSKSGGGGITRSTSASAASPSSTVGFTPRTAPLTPDGYHDDEDDVTYL